MRRTPYSATKTTAVHRRILICQSIITEVNSSINWQFFLYIIFLPLYRSAEKQGGFYYQEVYAHISEKSKIIAIANQKGGVGKTTTCANLGVGLAQEGKRVLLIDSDPQGSLSISLGFTEPDKLPYTLSTAMMQAIEDQPITVAEGILHHEEKVDLLPANIELAGLEVSLINAMSREKILKQCLEPMKRDYDYILIDCTLDFVSVAPRPLELNYVVKTQGIPVIHKKCTLGKRIAGWLLRDCHGIQ